MELSKIPISEHARELIQTSINNYQRHARLRITIDALNGRVAWVSAHQYQAAVNGRNLTEAEIIERATEVFAPMKAEGIEPIICPYTVEDHSPSDPVKKHRDAAHVQLRGFTGTVMRMVPPRVVLHMTENEGLKLLEMEHVAAGHFMDQITYKAGQWLKRAGYRERAQDQE